MGNAFFYGIFLIIRGISVEAAPGYPFQASSALRLRAFLQRNPCGTLLSLPRNSSSNEICVKD